MREENRTLNPMTAVPLAVTPILLIVEDHDMVRASLLDWLRVTFPAFDCREAQNGEDAVAMALAQPPAIILMDIGLPGMNGIEAARRIKMASPQTHVIMLSIHEDAHYRADAAAAGASAYVPKGRMHTDLIPIVKKLLPLIATMVLMILTGKGFPGG